MSSEQCSLAFTRLSFCLSSFGNIECLGHVAVGFHFNCYFTLCNKICNFSEEPGSWSISAIFSRFLPSFLFSIVLLITPFFIFIKFLFSYLWLFQFFPFCMFAFPICSFFQMELSDILFLWNVFTLAYRIWITASPSLFQVAAVWQCYKKPQWHQCWWQT